MSGLAFGSWWPLAVFLIVVPVVIWIGARSRTALVRSHRRALMAVRLLALGALAAALAQPTWHSRSGDLSVLYALDVSRSVDPAFIEAAIAWMKQANAIGRPAQSRFVAFADRVYPVDSPEAIRQVPLRAGDKGGSGALDPLETDLEAVLDAAAGSFDEGTIRRVVLMTDGVATRGNAWRMLDRLQGGQVRVFTVPATVRAANDAWVEAIDLPGELRRDEPFTATVRIRAHREAPAQVVITDGARRVLGRRGVRLVAGVNAVDFRVRLRDAGSTQISASVRADGDDVRENDTLTTSAAVLARPRVLYAESAPESARYLRDALAAQGIDVRVVAPDALPDTAGGLAAWDAVIVSDVRADMLGGTRMAAIERYVRDEGGGLVFASGASAYGEGGYRESALERVLPATFEAQEKRRDLALVIVLDRSYSMKGRKLNLAKAATLGALDLLEEEHRFGVVTFDSQPEITVPLEQVRSKRKAEDLIARFTASGQTNIYPALQMAYRMLVDVPVKAKHVILLSDGDTQPADFQRLVKRMAERQITVTTVAISAEADTKLMESIATWGKGRYYFTESAERVPQIFLEETRRVVNESVREEPVHVMVKRRVEALRGIDFARAPALKGLASMKPRDRAEIYLATTEDVPVLMRWQVGLGKAVVFASDVKNRWAADWLTWPGYGRMWSQIVREVMRRGTRSPAELTLAAEGGDVLVRLRAITVDGAFRNDLHPEARVDGLSDGPVTVSLRQVGPGSYEARIPRASGLVGTATATATLVGGVPADLRTAAGQGVLSRPFPAELRAGAPDAGFLEALAAQTGGRYAPAPGDVFAEHGEGVSVAHALWPWCAALGLLLYLADLFLRRAGWARRWFG